MQLFDIWAGNSAVLEEKLNPELRFICFLQRSFDLGTKFGNSSAAARFRASLRAPSSQPLAARTAARTTRAPGGSLPVTWTREKAWSAAAGLPDFSRAKASVLRASQSAGFTFTATSLTRSA